MRARLFDGLRSSDWPILEGIAPAMEATIVDVAGRLQVHTYNKAMQVVLSGRPGRPGKSAPTTSVCTGCF